MSKHDFILTATFIYFVLGGVFAFSVAALSYGFTGKGDKMIPLVFFFWPAMLILRVPYMPFIIAGVAAASLMTWLVSLVLSGALP